MIQLATSVFSISFRGDTCLHILHSSYQSIWLTCVDTPAKVVIVFQWGCNVHVTFVIHVQDSRVALGRIIVPYTVTCEIKNQSKISDNPDDHSFNALAFNTFYSSKINIFPVSYLNNLRFINIPCSLLTSVCFK